MPYSPELLGLIGLSFLFAGFVKGMLGMGLPTVAIGVMSLAMAPAQAAALLVAPSLVTNIWQVVAGPKFGTLLRRLWPMLVCICIGVWLGSGLMGGDKNGRAVFWLGIVLIVYAVLTLTAFRVTVPLWAEPWLSPIIGIGTGIVTAATGIFVVPNVPYLQSMQLEKEELIQALGISFMVATMALGVNLASVGVLETTVALGSLLAIIPAVIGMWLGQWVRLRTKPDVFRRWFLIGMLVLGAHLAISHLR